MKTIGDNTLRSIAFLVVEEAQSIFTECGAPDDFCVQDIGGASVVFGGWNRIIWTPGGGFRADKTACTTEFFDKFQAMNKGSTHADIISAVRFILDDLNSDIDYEARLILTSALNRASKRIDCAN